MLAYPQQIFFQLLSSLPAGSCKTSQPLVLFCPASMMAQYTLVLEHFGLTISCMKFFLGAKCSEVSSLFLSYSVLIRDHS